MTARPPPPSDLLRERPPARAGAVLYGLLLAVLAFYDLSGRSIFHRDLPRFATIAREMLRSGDWLVPTQHGEIYANKPILYVWLVALGSLLPGDPTAFTLRLPSALALIATGLATARWGRVRTGSVAAGRLAGLLVVTTYSMSELGRVGRPDMLSTCFATIAAALVDEALLRGDGRRPWLAIGLALGGGFLAKGPVVLLIPAALVASPRAGTTLGGRWRRVRLDAAVLVALVVSAAWLVPATIHGGTGFARRLVFDQVADRVKGEGNHQEAPWYYLATIPAGWLPWSPLLLAAGLAAATRRGRDALSGAQPVIAAAVALVVLCAVPTKEIRYAAILIPPLAVAAAQLLLAWGRRGRDDDAPSPARVHLVGLGVFAVAAAASAGVAAGTWPSTTMLLVPPALAALTCGVGALVRARRAISSREVRGRAVGLVVVLAACGLCAYWVVLGRYLVVTSVLENRAVAGALDPSVESVIVGGQPDVPLNPDVFYEGAPRARFARDVNALARFADVRPLQLIALDTDRAAIEARLGSMSAVLTHPWADGRTLLVLRRER